jgi:signal transduction histidine kinase
MTETLFAPINWIVTITDKLLTEATITDKQRKFLLSIASEAKELHSLILSIPDLSMEQDKQMMSYDGRSHLTSIIGYSEVLLDEIEGELSDSQRNLLREIRSNGRELLVQISELVES